jgi:hypothetical protein
MKTSAPIDICRIPAYVLPAVQHREYGIFVTFDRQPP